MGAQVRKGEKATLVVFWKFKDPSKQEDQAEAETDEAAESKRKVFARGYFVFNANQVDGYPPEPLPIITEKERIAAAEIFFQSTGAVIRHGGARAYYSPGLDHIQMKAAVVTGDDDGLQRYLRRLDGRRRYILEQPNLRIE